MVQLMTDEGLSAPTTGQTILPGATTGQAGAIRERMAAIYQQTGQAAAGAPPRMAALPARQPVGVEL
jgi:hypothetical protein